ncbi:hypothetical protein FN846DRAFT_622258 [Sphaerosporella brunnea]|uniref:Zn(2)-C6 fungal-type domain-containing protein n=1 Tax=Sphaerosporella brunnea TaxID=1250544 RepID=A0A5J5F0R1_9PEZI|nr:hypothetical protein FN846DRAFT_622258 [Sphaerosporella brunnea]
MAAQVPVAQTPAANTEQDQITHFTACDACRKRKKKCDGRIAGCQHCATKGLTCIYTAKRSKPSNTSHAKTHRTEGLEDLDERLRRIEAAVHRNLQLGGQAQETLIRHRRETSSSTSDDSDGELWEPRVSFLDTSTTSTPRPEADSPADQRQSPRFEGATGLCKRSASAESAIFVGASSPFSFVSRTGIKWVDAKLGDSSFSALLKRAEDAYDSVGVEDKPKHGLGGLATLGDAAAGYVETCEFRELYTNEYFRHINPLTPLFSPHFFHSPTPLHLRSPSIWAASTSIALALGAQHLSRLSPPNSPHHAAAQHYFAITARSLPNLLFANPVCIPAVQALVGMAFFYQESDDSQPSFPLLGLAAGVALQAGLHRDPQKLRVSCEEGKKERVNVWWVLFCLDREQALRTGRMSSISDRDVDVPPPPSSTPFGRRVQLAWTMARVARLLYSATPAPQPVVSALHAELDAWRRAAPEVHLPLPLALRSATTWEDHADLMRMRWNYFCTLTSIEQLGSGAGGLEAWALAEAKAATQELLRKRVMMCNRGTLCILAAAAWALFSVWVCGEGREDRQLARVLTAFADALEEGVWRPGEGMRVKALFLELVRGMAELVGREACR